MSGEGKTIPEGIRRTAYIVASDIRHHIAHSKIELIKNDPDVTSMVATAIHDAVMAERAEWESKIEEWEDKIDGLQADLDNAVDTAFARGATEWTRLNYPDRFAKLISSTKPGA
jgi:hypothetical protein